MLKKGDLSKVQISKPEEKSRTTAVETVRCSICDEVAAMSVLHIHDSGQWARQTVQPETETPRRETSDSIRGLIQCCSNTVVTRCDMVSLGNKDFASGDHHHCSKCFREIPKAKSLNNMGTNVKATAGRYSLPGEFKGIHKKSTETTIKYKNVNFRESESLLSLSGSNGHEATQNVPEKPTDVLHRPITCPISDCRKMIARASILQHFIFDHSKVPRMTLKVADLQRIFINISTITEELRCYAVFLEASSNHPADLNALTNGGHKNASFLLMGVRMPRAETIKKPHGSKPVSMRDVETQTEAPVKSSKVCLQTKAVRNSTNVDGVDGYFADYHDIILLWICKLVNDKAFYYTISIKRSDRRLGYSFTGETLNVEYIHDLRTIYQQVECLRILEKASTKLMNEQNELEITVNIFK